MGVYHHIMMLCIFRYDIIFFNDLKYFYIMVMVKKLFRKKLFIHYCTELFEDKEIGLSLYKKYANIFDFIIDVEPNRGNIREKIYKLKNKPKIILNTLPSDELPVRQNKGGLLKIAGIKNDSNLPIIIYTGGAFPGRGLDVIVNAIKKLEKKSLFIAFVYGDKKSIAKLKNLCRDNLEIGTYIISNEKSREILLSCTYEANCGIVYYPPSESIGCKYAAPSKFFEYLSCGIPVVTSPNKSLIEIIDLYKCGAYAKDESDISLSYAIEKVLNEENSKISSNAEYAFRKYLNYEIQSKDTIDELIKLLNNYRYGHG